MNVLVTGSSRGIGSEVVKRFAQDKNNTVVAFSRDQKRLEELAEYCLNTYDNQIYIYSIDFLSDTFEESLQAIIEELDFHFDVVINNAGLLYNKEFNDFSNEDILNLFKVNTFAPITIIQALLRNIDKNKFSHIVNIGSMGGYQGSVKFPGLSIYSSSKAALANLTECLAEEYKETQIKFNCLALSSVQTEMLNEAFPGYKAQTTPKKIAEFIVYFALNNHQFYNGKVLPVSFSTP